MTHDYTIIDHNGNKFHVNLLSKELCKIHCMEILEIINIIPHIHWTEKELFFEKDFFKNKWQYSFIVTDSANVIIGVLLAYFRLTDNKHIMDSLYIHKIAIKPEFQNNGIGTELIKYFIKKSYAEIDWLWNISVQTNDEISNKYVIDFYQKIGFSKYYNIEYIDKTDILMVYERDVFANSSLAEISNLSFLKKRLKHPRINIIESIFYEGIKMPIIYFSSTNEKKKALVKFIFNNYNFEVIFTSSNITLTEPQIESTKLDEEQNLVRFPLKLLSRFINKTPYVIEDSMLFIEYFNRSDLDWELPGHDTKRWWKQLGANGVLNILGDSAKRKARFVSQIGGYIKPNEYYFGRGETSGHIAHRIAIPSENQKGVYPSFFHLIFIPEGADKVLAEMNMFEFAKYDYMRKSIFDFIEKIKYNYTFTDQITLF